MQGRTQDSVQGGASFNFRAKREKFFEFAPPDTVLPPPERGAKRAQEGAKIYFSQLKSLQN